MYMILACVIQIQEFARLHKKSNVEEAKIHYGAIVMNQCSLGSTVTREGGKALLYHGFKRFS